MPVQVNCGCGKDYQIADGREGKKFRCKECGDVLTVPAPSRPKKPPRKTVRKKRPRPKPEPVEDDYEDYSYDEYDDSAYDDHEDYEDYSPSRRASKPKKKKKKRKSRPTREVNWTPPPGGVILVWILLLICAGLNVVGFLKAKEALEVSTDDSFFMVIALPAIGSVALFVASLIPTRLTWAIARGMLLFLALCGAIGMAGARLAAKNGAEGTSIVMGAAGFTFFASMFIRNRLGTDEAMEFYGHRG